MGQNAINFPELVDIDPLLAEIFYQQYNQLPAQRNMIFGVRGSNKAVETDLRIGSFRDPKEFKGVVEYDTADPDFSVTYAHTAYSLGFTVTRDMIDDNQYEGIFERASELATSFARKQEKDAASVFNNAFSGVTGYDAKTLCANDHPRSKTDSTSVDNLATLALNSDNLQAAIDQLEGLGDDRGEEINTVADLLIVPRALRKTAFELVESELTPENANNAANIHMGMKTLVWPRLTNSSAWFVCDSVQMKRWLKWYDRIPVEFASDDDFNTLIRRFRGYMRYSFGWSDFRFVVGSSGAP
jgi:phage major head subunit gpT-like protein